MRVMIDTNILISAIVFQNMDRLVEKLQKHTLVISSYILDEAREVIRRKFPEYETSMEIFFN